MNDRVKPMRRLLLVVLGLAACTSPTGEDVDATSSGEDALVVVDRGDASEVTSAVLGVRLRAPKTWRIEQETHALDRSWGFTAWGPERTDAPTLHLRRPVLRVAMVTDGTAADLDARVASREKGSRREVLVGTRGVRGIAVGPFLGSTPYVEVWFPANGKLYRVNVYGTAIGAEAERLLRSIELSPPRRAIDTLHLDDGNGDALRVKGRAEKALKEAAARAGRDPAHVAPRTFASGGEVPLSDGCWRMDSDFFVQTQHGMYANERWGPSYTGWTIIGRPNFWNQYSHGQLGYGYCAEPYNTNDKYAIDYPLDYGDVVFSPFAAGYVTFAGRNFTHADYGILVTIVDPTGKYVSLSGHLSALAEGIYPGAYVTDETIIGFAGDTGGGVIAVGEPHLHQAFYRYPSYNADGSPFGGAGVQVVHHRYLGTAAGTGPGTYTFGWASDATTWSQGNWISN